MTHYLANKNAWPDFHSPCCGVIYLLLSLCCRSFSLMHIFAHSLRACLEIIWKSACTQSTFISATAEAEPARVKFCSSSSLAIWSPRAKNVHWRQAHSDIIICSWSLTRSWRRINGCPTVFYAPWPKNYLTRSQSGSNKMSHIGLLSTIFIAT